SRISFGKTGIMRPIARMSRVTVTRMKMTAAGRDFMELKHECNVVAAVVSTGEEDGVAASAYLEALLRCRNFHFSPQKLKRAKASWVDRVEGLAVASHPLQLRRGWQTNRRMRRY